MSQIPQAELEDGNGVTMVSEHEEDRGLSDATDSSCIFKPSVHDMRLLHKVWLGTLT